MKYFITSVHGTWNDPTKIGFIKDSEIQLILIQKMEVNGN
jgi:hypothetical protein